MPYTPDQLEDKLRNSLETSYVKVEDLSDGCGAKFSCVVVTKQFDGVALLQRHRMVNTALEEEMKSIHAMTLKTLTPDQWQKLQQDS
jgi:stress-induced morphogen